MKTNEEIKEKYEEKRTFGGEHSYEEVEAIFDDKIDIALNEARVEGYNKAIAEQEGRYKIHEKYHELNDKDIEDKARAEGYKQGHIDTLKKLEHSIENMYKDAASGENGGTSDQEGLSRALGLIKSEIKKVD